MSFKIDKILKILYNPKEAFEEMKEDVNIAEGIAIAIILIGIGGIISYGLIMSSIGGVIDEIPREIDTGEETIEVPEEIANFMEQETPLIIGLIVAIGALISLSVLFITALIAGWITARYEKEKFRLKRTIGLIGYSSVVDLIQTVIIIVILAYFLRYLATSIIAGEILKIANIGIGILAIIPIAIVLFFWELWIKGTAIAVANNSKTIIGMVTWFIVLMVISSIFGSIDIGTIIMNFL